MAYREIGMWEILEVLRRVARGEPQRAIQRATGHSRTTIRRWLRVARRLGWEPGEGEPDEALAARGGQAGAPRAGRGRAGGESAPAPAPPGADPGLARARGRAPRAAADQGPSAARPPGRRGALQLAPPLRGPALWLHRPTATDRAPGRDGARRAGRGRLRTSRSCVGSRGRTPARLSRADRHARPQPPPVRLRHVLPEDSGPDRRARGGLGLLWRGYRPGRARQSQGGRHEGRPLRPRLPAHLRRVRPRTAAS